MAIILTENAQKEFITTRNSNGKPMDIVTYWGGSHIKIARRIVTFSEGQSPVGAPKSNENLIPLHYVDLGLMSTSVIKGQDQSNFSYTDNIGIGYYMRIMDNELDQSQQLTDGLFLTWTDDDNPYIDGKTIDFDYVLDHFTIDIS